MYVCVCVCAHTLTHIHTYTHAFTCCPGNASTYYMCLCYLLVRNYN